MNNVTPGGRLDWSSVIRVPASAEAVGTYSLHVGDVLFNNTNSAELVGKTAVFEGSPEPVVFSNHFTRLRTKEDTLLPGFLAAWLQTLWQGRVFAHICHRWVGQAAVQRDRLLALEIPLPPLGEQRWIVERVNLALTAIARARAAAEAQLKGALLLRAAHVNDIFSRARSGWPSNTLREVCEGDGQYGLSERANSAGPGIAILGMANLVEGGIRWEPSKVVQLSDDDIAKYRLDDGDLLFNRTNSAALVGKTAVFKGHREAVFASYLIRFRIHRAKAEPEFIAAYINSGEGREFIRRNMARAIGQVNISASTMHHMPVPMPSLAEQTQIVKTLDARLALVKQVEQTAREQLNAIDAVPAALLRQAFRGDL